MRKSKTHFEQVSVEKVKKIAKEFPENHTFRNDKAGPKTKSAKSSTFDEKQLRQRRSFEKVRDELNRLMADQLESLKGRGFAKLDKVELRQEEVRLKRIQEVCSELSAILKKSLP